MTLNFNLLTLFPDMFPGMLGHSLAGKALERGDWSFDAINIRDFATDNHKTVDDTPYGGGAGMVMRADVIESALLSITTSASSRRRSGSIDLQQQDPVLQRDDDNVGRKIYLSPRGKVFNQALAKELSQEENITLLCGRYEGVDQRVLNAHDFEEISIGDYVLSGGEPAAMILMDACIRLLDGVMGNENTADNESFGLNTGGLLEYPHYTRPAEWTDANGVTHYVPEVLKNGNHAHIKEWQKEESLKITQKVRSDLVE